MLGPVGTLPWEARTVVLDYWWRGALGLLLVLGELCRGGLLMLGRDRSHAVVRRGGSDAGLVAIAVGWAHPSWPSTRA